VNRKEPVGRPAWWHLGGTLLRTADVIEAPRDERS
jgi:hypothetical protein